MLRQRYIVETGNIIASIDLPQDTEGPHMEAATRVFESIFGNKDVKEFDIIALFDQDGTNIFKLELKEFEEMPEVQEFAGVLVEVFVEGDVDEKKTLILTSQVFMNAALPQYANIALDYEKKWVTQSDEDIEHI